MRQLVESFGSTYEGLKQLLERPELVPHVRFGSTYEGLKPTLQVSCTSNTQGFGSTYEGLKPVLLAQRIPEDRVLAVPMRA